MSEVCAGGARDRPCWIIRASLEGGPAHAGPGIRALWPSLGLGTTAALLARENGETPMSSSWPILVGMIAVVFAAFWYDASFATTGAQPPPAAQALSQASAR